MDISRIYNCIPLDTFPKNYISDSLLDLSISRVAAVTAVSTRILAPYRNCDQIPEHLSAMMPYSYALCLTLIGNVFRGSTVLKNIVKNFSSQKIALLTIKRVHLIHIAP